MKTLLEPVHQRLKSPVQFMSRLNNVKVMPSQIKSLLKSCSTSREVIVPQTNTRHSSSQFAIQQETNMEWRAWQMVILFRTPDITCDTR